MKVKFLKQQNLAFISHSSKTAWVSGGNEYVWVYEACKGYVIIYNTAYMYNTIYGLISFSKLLCTVGEKDNYSFSTFLLYSGDWCNCSL